MSTRADVYLVEHGIAATRAEAQAAIRAGNVKADGKPVVKVAQIIAEGAAIEYAKAHNYVSRGALKLIAALDHFELSPAGLVFIDVGASTGGFTEVLLERGARRVFAVDVGHGQLHGKLRSDPRVVTLEGVNARELSAAHVLEEVDGVVADVSFIPLKLVLPGALKRVRRGGWLVALVKPQFEVGPDWVGKGVVRDKMMQEGSLQAVATWLDALPGWSVIGTMESPVLGGDGNREFLLAAKRT
jgi:23S rRNA (cytidine1920-2'-O)/16S rRNA (cytidine1409-2'-O)-methyltransferase